MVEKRVIPEFQSEAEEAQWWFDHQDELLDDFIAAEAEGRLLPGPALMYRVPPYNVVHLKPAAVATAREQAARKGLAYEEYVEQLVEEGLVREAEASAKAHGTATAAAA
jgi:hypothetical protein